MISSDLCCGVQPSSLRGWIAALAVFASLCASISGARGEPQTIQNADICALTYGTRQLKVYELADGRVLALWDQRLYRVSLETFTASPVSSELNLGRVEGIHLLADGSVLVFAENGLYRMTGQDGIALVADCEQLGAVHSMQQFADGRFLISGRQSNFLFSPPEALTPFAPFWVWGVNELPDGTVLAIAAEHLLRISPDGAVTPLAIGSLRSRDVVLLAGGRALLVSKSGVARLLNAKGELEPLHESLTEAIDKTTPLPQGGALLEAKSGRAWVMTAQAELKELALPEDDPALQRFELMDKRVFWASSQGLLTVGGAGAIQNLAPEVRSDKNPECRVHVLEDPAGKPALAQVGERLIWIDPDNRVRLAGEGTMCFWLSGHDAAGRLLVLNDKRLMRFNSDGEPDPLRDSDAAGGPRQLSAAQGDIVVQTESGVWRVGADDRLRKLSLPEGTDPEWKAVSHDPEGALLVCFKDGRLLRLTGSDRLEPLAGAEGLKCDLVYQKEADLAVVSGEREHLLLFAGGKMARIKTDEGGSRLVFTKLAGGQTLITSGGDLFALTGDQRLEPIHLPPVEPLRDLRPADLHFIGSLHFVDERHGWALWGPAQLARTSDGGASWTLEALGVEVGEEAPQLISVEFSGDGRVGLGVGTQGQVWRSEDSGRTWQRQPDLGSTDLGPVWLTRDGKGAWVLAVDPYESHDRNRNTRLYTTQDGGQSWTELQNGWRLGTFPVGSPHSFSALGSMVMSEDGQRGWVADGAGNVHATADGGRTWSLQWHFPEARTYHCSTEEHGFLSPEICFPIHAIAPATDTFRGCTAGQWGLFCATDPSGELRRVEAARDVEFTGLAVAPDGLHAWAVGTEGTILATEDGGSTWTPQASGTTAELRGILFLADGVHGWVWGEDGLLATQDGGKTWRAPGAR